MRRVVEPRFQWRGVVLIAIAFALIGLAVLFRSGGSDAPASAGVAAPPPDLRPLFGSLAFGALLVVAMLLGAWFGYLHLLRRARSRPRTEHETDSHQKT